MGQRVVNQSFVSNRIIKSGYRISYFWYQDIMLWITDRQRRRQNRKPLILKANQYSIKKRRREEVFKWRSQVREAGRVIGSLSG